jgi:hypothetical protein
MLLSPVARGRFVSSLPSAKIRSDKILADEPQPNLINNSHDGRRMMDGALLYMEKMSLDQTWD